MRYFEWFGLDVCCDLDSRRLSSARAFSFRDANENKEEAHDQMTQSAQRTNMKKQASNQSSHDLS
jgi:hypothetical protein